MLVTAQRGLYLAMKLHNPLLRFLRGPGRRVVLALLAVVLGVCAVSPAWYPIGIVTLVVTGVIALCSESLFFLAMRAVPSMRKTLDQKDVRSSNGFAAAALCFAVAASAWFVTRLDAYAYGSVFVAIGTVIVSAAGSRPPGRIRTALHVVAGGWMIAAISDVAVLVGTGRRTWAGELNHLRRTAGADLIVHDTASYVLSALGIALVILLFGFTFKGSLYATKNRELDRAVDAAATVDDPRLIPRSPFT